MLSIYTPRINIYILILIHTHIYIYTHIINAYQQTAVGEWNCEWNYWTSSETLPGGYLLTSNLLFCGLITRRLYFINDWLYILHYIYMYTCILRAELNRSRGLSRRCFPFRIYYVKYTRPISSWREYLVNGLCCMITCYTIWLDFTCNGLPDS